MSKENVICFGQQPNGFFPKRYLVAKINSARNLQTQIGGKIIFFYHDSDADYRETITPLIDSQTKAEVRLNFTQENKLQKNFSPLYLKRIPANWQKETLKQLPRFLPGKLTEMFKSVSAKNAADFCLEMYHNLGLLKDITVIRSSDPDFRQKALALSQDYFADVDYEGEIVRAKIEGATAVLHHGGGKFTRFEPKQPISKRQITPGRDSRFAWMNSVINCSHYVTGNAEFDYLNRDGFPEVKFIKREQIENQDLAWLPS